VLAREGGGPVVVSDASLPALEKAVAKRRQGVLLWRDEPTAWLARLGRKSRRDESRRGPFLDTWGAIGFPWTRDKAVVGTAVSIVGSLDPERLDAALEGAGDGLAARFLYVWPGPAPYRSLRAIKPVREDEAVNALQRIARAVGTPEKPLVLAFEDQAVTIFDGCLEVLHGETLRAEGLLAGWLGKGRGTVARLADGGVGSIRLWPMTPSPSYDEGTSPCRTPARGRKLTRFTRQCSGANCGNCLHHALGLSLEDQAGGRAVSQNAASFVCQLSFGRPDTAPATDDLAFGLHQAGLRRNRPDKRNLELERCLRKALVQHRLDREPHAAVEQRRG